MTRRHWVILIACSFLCFSSRGDNWNAGGETVERAVVRVKPALVRIEVVAAEFEGGRAVKHEAAGSGVIIRKDGYILSNHHVAGHATRLVCILADNEEIEAELIGTDPLADLAVLRLKTERSREFPVAVFGDSDRLRVGDPVLAMGSPLALSQSVTRGIVSNTKLIMSRALESGGRFMLDGEDVGSLVRWIMHDAQILPGNSGGPLVNLSGEIVGINEIGFGLGGAIPGNLAQQVACELIERGRVRRSWMGVEIQPLLKSGGTKDGALVSGVIEDSPAAKAGLRAGDVLVRMAGREVLVHHAEEIPLFTQLLAGMPVGGAVEVVVRRGGELKKFSVTMVERPAMEPKTRELKTWGVTVRDISFLVAKEMRLPDTSGALVTSVRSGGPGGEAKPALKWGDVLREVGGRPVRNVADLVEISAQIAKDETEPVPVLVAFDRRREKMMTVVKIGIKELEAPGIEARKASLAASVQAISREMAEQLGCKGVTGVRVTQVYPDSSAAASGLRVGDLIVALDGEKIAVSQPGDEEVFTQMIRQFRIGAKADVSVLRGAEKLTVTVELTTAPKPEREMKRYSDANFEFMARDLTYFDRLNRQWEEGRPGVMVVEVAEGSWAALGGMRGGDLIISINQQSIADVAALEKTLKQLAQGKPRQVVLGVQRGIHSLYLELEPDWNQKESTPKGAKS